MDPITPEIFQDTLEALGPLGILLLGTIVVGAAILVGLRLAGRIDPTAFRRYAIGTGLGVGGTVVLLGTVGILDVERTTVGDTTYRIEVGDDIEVYDNDALALSDGPYVFWESDSLARVASFCGRAPKATTVSASDTLRFEDPCTPSDTYAFPATPPTPDPAEYEGASRIFAVSDVEGHYDRFVNLLQAAGVVDDKAQWAWGDGHLVLAGDLVDRGTQVTEVLWLIHRLERQARRAGGRVHYILGNHEAMLLRGDTRYANVKYNLVARRLNTTTPGLYGADTELGRWLRTKPVMVRIDSLLFAHGGVSPTLGERNLSLAEINEGIRGGLRYPMRSHTDPAVELLFDDEGPLWYRGYFLEEEPRPRTFQSALAPFGAGRVVVGHTPVDSVQTRHDGIIVAIDVGFREPEQGEGLLIEEGKFYRIDVQGTRVEL